MARGITNIEETYQNLLEYHNSITQLKTCECGKITSNKCYEKHLNSKIHFILLSYKKRIEEQRKNQTTENEGKNPTSTEPETC